MRIKYFLVFFTFFVSIGVFKKITPITQKNYILGSNLDPFLMKSDISSGNTFINDVLIYRITLNSVLQSIDVSTGQITILRVLEFVNPPNPNYYILPVSQIIFVSKARRVFFCISAIDTNTNETVYDVAGCYSANRNGGNLRKIFPTNAQYPIQPSEDVVRMPVGLCFDDFTGELYVSDSKLNIIYLLSPNRKPPRVPNRYSVTVFRQEGLLSVSGLNWFPPFINFPNWQGDSTVGRLKISFNDPNYLWATNMARGTLIRFDRREIGPSNPTDLIVAQMNDYGLTHIGGMTFKNDYKSIKLATTVQFNNNTANLITKVYKIDTNCLKVTRLPILINNKRDYRWNVLFKDDNTTYQIMDLENYPMSDNMLTTGVDDADMLPINFFHNYDYSNNTLIGERSQFFNFNITKCIKKCCIW